MDVCLSSIQCSISKYLKEKKGITPKPSATTSEQMGIQALEKQVKKWQPIIKNAAAFSLWK